ncbi:GH11287 [Drosophila grimshawi]|uniref:GH11287 n=1 Tax=Drosophila grimshawi TaxID=7222 RepID=B4JE10_DROGR|nr:GH11287 [Drosophila grimshawi]
MNAISSHRKWCQNVSSAVSDGIGTGTGTGTGQTVNANSQSSIPGHQHRASGDGPQHHRVVIRVNYELCRAPSATGATHACRHCPLNAPHQSGSVNNGTDQLEQAERGHSENEEHEDGDEDEDEDDVDDDDNHNHPSCLVTLGRHGRHSSSSSSSNRSSVLPTDLNSLMDQLAHVLVIIHNTFSSVQAMPKPIPVPSHPVCPQIHSVLGHDADLTFDLDADVKVKVDMDKDVNVARGRLL